MDHHISSSLLITSILKQFIILIILLIVLSECLPFKSVEQTPWISTTLKPVEPLDLRSNLKLSQSFKSLESFIIRPNGDASESISTEPSSLKSIESLKSKSRSKRIRSSDLHQILKSSIDYHLLDNDGQVIGEASPRRKGRSPLPTSVKAIVHINEMTEPMKEMAITLAAEGFEKFTDYNDVAEYMCTQMDAKYDFEDWSCIVGSNFGYSVPYKAGKYIEFYLGLVRVLLFVADKSS